MSMNDHFSAVLVKERQPFDRSAWFSPVQPTNPTQSKDQILAAIRGIQSGT